MVLEALHTLTVFKKVFSIISKRSNRPSLWKRKTPALDPEVFLGDLMKKVGGWGWKGRRGAH